MHTALTYCRREWAVDFVLFSKRQKISYFCLTLPRVGIINSHDHSWSGTSHVFSLWSTLCQRHFHGCSLNHLQDDIWEWYNHFYIGYFPALLTLKTNMDAEIYRSCKICIFDLSIQIIQGSAFILSGYWFFVHSLHHILGNDSNTFGVMVNIILQFYYETVGDRLQW